jgi:hypothetical protein
MSSSSSRLLRSALPSSAALNRSSAPNLRLAGAQQNWRGTELSSQMYESSMTQSALPSSAALNRSSAPNLQEQMYWAQSVLTQLVARAATCCSMHRLCQR